ncbi:MAG: hypothetical protein GX126_05820 [Bacteroidales bacterium]|nr:hypothetical protein [Bacteroidales bacterium]
MDFFFYFIKIRFNLLFRNAGKSRKRLILFFVFPAFLLYAFFLSNYMGKLEGKGIIRWEDIFVFLYYGTSILVFISFFFPKYKSSKESFGKIYPINNFTRGLTGLISDCLSRFIIIFAVVILILALFFKIPFPDRIRYAGSLLTGMLNAVIFSRNLRFLVEKDFHKGVFRLSGWLLMLVICAGFLIFMSKYNYSLIFNVLITIAGFGLLIVLNKWTYDRRIIDRGSHMPLILQLYIRNKIFRVSVLIMFSIKLIIILFFFFLFKIDPDTNIVFKIPIVLYTSPVLIFTYLFNNFFGFFPGFITSFKIADSGYDSLTGLLLKAVLPLIFLDCLLSVGFIMVGKYDLPSWLLFYLSVLLLLIPVSFHLSVFRPNLIKAAFSSSNNRPLLNSFSMIPALTASLCYIYFQSLLPLIFLVFLIISILTLRSFVRRYKKRFYPVVSFT